MSAVGHIVLVLHSHIPYVRRAGRWPHGEEWLYQAICETYIPLLTTLFDLIEHEIDFSFTLGITPVLAEQLSDELLLHGLEQYIDSRIQLLRQDVLRFEGNYQLKDSDNDLVDPQLLRLARWYLERYTQLKRTYIDRFDRDLIAQFRWLQDNDYIEIMTSAATHSFLPLNNTDLRKAQIQTAITSYTRLFDKSPEVFWLPECGYEANGDNNSSMETQLTDAGIKLFFTESYALDADFVPQPVQYVESEDHELMNSLQWRSESLDFPETERDHPRTFQAYKVEQTRHAEKVNTPIEKPPKPTDEKTLKQSSEIHVIARNKSTSQQVWSHISGYPGHPVYRDFHKSAHTSGIKYWSITARNADFADKDYYRPKIAEQQAQQDAHKFVRDITQSLSEYAENSGKNGMVCIAFDTELFGHWWFEGISFLREFLFAVAESSEVNLTKGGNFITQNQPDEAITLSNSSWGAGGGDWTWKNEHNNWVQELLDEAYEAFLNLVKTLENPRENQSALNQMCRELLIAQSSDWLFLMTSKQAADYARERIETHLKRFNDLLETLKTDGNANYLAKQYFEIDNLFPDIDYRWFLP